MCGKSLGYWVWMLPVWTVLTGTSAGQWIERLPEEARSAILWSADHEEGTLDDWTIPQHQYAGGGIFNTGGSDAAAAAVTHVAHSGRFAAGTVIRNAYRAENGSRAVRLMRWTDRAWDDGGEFFPRHAYYSTWVYFPHNYNPNKYEPWDPGDGGWWNVFQFKAKDAHDKSRPMWTLNIHHDDESGVNSFYLFSKHNAPASHSGPRTIPIPIGRWVHVEAYYSVSIGNQGRITIWQDGRRIIDVSDVRTALVVGSAYAIWGIGNYTDHIDGGPRPGSATLYFDDSMVSTERISRYLADAAVIGKDRHEVDAPPRRETRR